MWMSKPAVYQKSEVARPASFRQEPGLVPVAAGGAQQMHGHTSGKQHCISSLSYVTWQTHLMGLSPEIL